MKNFSLLCFILFFCANLLAQKKLANNAEKQYDELAYAYVNSDDLYGRLIEKGYDSSRIFAKLGDSYFFNGDYKNALKAYNHVGKLKDNYIFPIDQLFRYAQCLKSDGQFEEASKLIKQLNAKSGKKAIYADTDYLQEIINQSNRFSIKPVSINSTMPDYGVAFYKENQVIYTSARDTNVVESMKDRWSKKPFFKLYEATITSEGDLINAKKLTGKINSVFHQSTPVITNDGKHMYFTRSNFLDNKYSIDNKKINRLRIYRATLEDGKWGKIEDLSINNDAFSNAHPALTPDGKILIFASDRPGSLGETDLYEVDIKDDGTFGEVKSMGSKVNTIGRETFPFISTLGQFYFASDGHPGIGGLDIFEGIKDNNNSYIVVNVGTPINSKEDDFGFIINSKKQRGFFASNRTNEDQIYSFIELQPLDFKYELLVFGKVYDKKYNEVLPKTKIIVFDANNKKIDEYYTDNAGEYILKIPSGDYFLMYEKNGYIEQKHQLFIPKKDRNQSFEINKYMEIDSNSDSLITENNKLIIDGSDLVKVLDLKPIYFNWNTAKIRSESEEELNRVIQVLKDYPTVSIKVKSYSDSRGNSSYNLTLSKKRVNMTINYLLERGVRKERISGQGYGESKLLNDCIDGVKCTEEQHQLNRRSEFIIRFNNK